MEYWAQVFSLPDHFSITPTAQIQSGCLLFVENGNWLPLLVTLQLPLFQRQVCRLPHSAAKWSLGKVPPLRFLGVDQT